ncbi:MAG: hypothetical protein WKG07_34390 [Hymenobacter sp.]
MSPAQVRRWNELPKHAAALKAGRELRAAGAPTPSPNRSRAGPVAVVAACACARARQRRWIATPRPWPPPTLRYAREAQATAQREERAASGAAAH